MATATVTLSIYDPQTTGTPTLSVGSVEAGPDPTK